MNPRTLTALVAGAAVLGIIVSAPAQHAPGPSRTRQPLAAQPAPPSSPFGLYATWEAPASDPFGYAQPLPGAPSTRIDSLLSAARTLEAGGFADRAASLRAEASQLAARYQPAASGGDHDLLIAEVRALRSEVGRLMDMVAALRAELRGNARRGGLLPADTGSRPSGFGSSRAPMAGGNAGAGSSAAPSAGLGRRRGGPAGGGGGITGGSGRGAAPAAGGGRRRSAPARQAPPGAGGGSGGRSSGGQLPPGGGGRSSGGQLPPGGGGGSGSGGGPLPPATAPASAPGGGTGR